MPLCPSDPPEMETGRLPRRAEELIPHSGPMCVIDELVRVGEKCSEAVVTIKGNSPFLRKDGTLEECLFVEMIAQAIAARSGFEISDEKRKTQSGYLLGIRNLKVTGTARAGDTLRIEVCKSAQYGDFCVIEGSVFRGAEVLACGEIKVVQIFEGKAHE